MSVRRTPQAEAILELRLALAEAGKALMDAPPHHMPDALQQARADVIRAWDRAQTVGVHK